jgi:hypothetical protein
MIDRNSSDDGQGKPIDQSSKGAEECNQSRIHQDSLHTDQLANNKDAGKGYDWVR